jgi:hypothetical protein
MHNRIPMPDVFLQHAQRVAAERLEILLDFHLDVRPRQRFGAPLHDDDIRALSVEHYLLIIGIPCYDKTEYLWLGVKCQFSPIVRGCDGSCRGVPVAARAGLSLVAASRRSEAQNIFLLPLAVSD